MTRHYQPYKPDVCIYHNNCIDGFGAAWAVNQHFGDYTRYVAANYSDDIPTDVLNQHVLLVDFSYSKENLQELARSAKTVTIIDHHKSAREALAEYIIPGAVNAFNIEERVAIEKWGTIRAIFDMEKSGAVLTWEFFNRYPTQEAPYLLQLIQDRDLWKFQIPESKDMHAYLSSVPTDFTIWDTIDIRMQSPSSLIDVLEEGAAINRKHLKDINDALADNVRLASMAGYIVPIANMPYKQASDAGHILANGHPFAATYFDSSTHRVFSLRSAKDGIDVSLIAKKWGGGGHFHAAGFSIKHGETYMRIPEL